MENAIEKLKKILKRETYTPIELVNMGIFGSKYGVYNAIKNGRIQTARISRQRIIIFKDSLLEYLKKMNPSS